MLRLKKLSRMTIILFMALAAGLNIGCSTSETTENNWVLYEFPNYDNGDTNDTMKISEKLRFSTDQKDYLSSTPEIKATLVSLAFLEHLTCGESYILVKQVGEDWFTVPFKDDKMFNSIARVLDVGQSHDYIIKASDFADEFTAGVYRIVTDVWYGDTVRESVTVWAEFEIH